MAAPRFLHARVCPYSSRRLKSRTSAESIGDTSAQRAPSQRPIPASGPSGHAQNRSVPSSEIRTRVGDRELNLSNLDKVLYPLTGYTKAEVVNYYVAMAPVLLPHIRDRVITRVRFPDGVDAPSFYEKNAPQRHA